MYKEFNINFLGNCIISRSSGIDKYFSKQVGKDYNDITDYFFGYNTYDSVSHGPVRGRGSFLLVLKNGYSNNQGGITNESGIQYAVPGGYTDLYVRFGHKDSGGTVWNKINNQKIEYKFQVNCNFDNNGSYVGDAGSNVGVISISPTADTTYRAYATRTNGYTQGTFNLVRSSDGHTPVSGNHAMDGAYIAV